MFNGEIFWRLSYYVQGITIEGFVGQLVLELIMENSLTFFHYAKHFENKNEIMYKSLKIPADNMLIHAGNGDIKINLEKANFYYLIKIHYKPFSLHNEIEIFPPVEVHLKLYNEVLFIVNTYATKRGKNQG